jgi:hypothetical protein
MRLLSSHKVAGIVPVGAFKDTMSDYFSIRHQKYGYWQVAGSHQVDTRPPRRWVRAMEYATKYPSEEEACMAMLFRSIHNGEVVPNTTPFVEGGHVAPTHIPVHLA